MSSYTLGLDIGSNSIGWALLQGGQEPSIIDLGVRVFPEGIDRDTQGAEKSKNATRREARGSRRIRYRHNLRRDQLVKILKSAGLLPEDDIALGELFNRIDPYKLRARGLDEKLELYEFGRALFHINQRRGFKSNRKTGKAKEDGKVATEAGELQERIDKAGCRTLGEYFANINPEENRIREQYTFRSMYEREFDLLWERQAKFYTNLLTEDLQKKIRDEIIFYQRPLKPSDDLIGQCELEPEEKRCPRGDWYARQFRILQDVNNLKIYNPDGSEAKLTDEQRQLVLKELRQKKEVKFEKIRKMLGLMETQEFNLEQDGKVKLLKGDDFSVAMRNKKIFGPKVWDEMDGQEKIELNTAVLELDDDELIEKMASDYSFTGEQIERILKVSLPQRYMSFSRKAIMKLLPFMEEGALTSDAVRAAYPDRDRKAVRREVDKLPMSDDLRNPIVNKALFEVRKVVNATIREYGKPVKIVIEMARDVKGSKRERDEIQFKMRVNEKRNEDARTRLIQDMDIPNPSRDDIIKYKLWEECGKKCPYTGKSISQTALFGPNPEFQIEHILPYNRSLDDSYMNKTLCDVYENIHVKGDKIPFEAYSLDEEKYEQIKQRIKVLPWPKRRKFLQREISLDECIQRELNDTRYICKEVIKYLKQLGVNVRGTKGRITAELRHQWGLNSILDLVSVEMKNRNDHRHHTIDAAVVAITKNEHLRRLAKSKYSKVDSSFPEPWLHFREELAEKVKHINVSYRATRKVSGQLHEETSYGLTEQKDDKGQDIFVYRKKLEDLTIPMVAKIVDPVVRQIIKTRLSKHGIEPDKNQKIPKEVWSEPLYMKQTKSNKKVTIKKVRIRDVFNNMILLKDKFGKPYRAVASGNNHHIEIFEYKVKQGQTKRDGKVITMFEAVHRNRRGESVVQKNYGPHTTFICSLANNDMVMMPNTNGDMDLYRVQKMSINKQIYFRHHTAATINDDSTLIRKQASSFKGYKVAVDPLGRIWPARD
ncbi:MAG TPA: type II CRISPR RNA-guided endonuclease Cas9 [Sedimentisphaerales bacterium]|nr:type II CRISPR RNA-guided endonuclease Cas9 [Sedimentisphaerales bacterium]